MHIHCRNLENPWKYKEEMKITFFFPLNPKLMTVYYFGAFSSLKISHME